MKHLDLVGSVFDRLTVVENKGKDNKGSILWLCQCSCGTQVTTSTFMLRTKKKRSCGCLRREKAAAHCKSMTRHGHYQNNKPTPEWSTWASMRARCTVKTHKQYPDYGGRGIGVCDRWLSSFESFLADMGPRPGKLYSLDRIDNALGYSKENCRWATHVEQNNNTRFNSHISVDGTTKTKAEWCRELGISRGRLRRALERTSNPAAALLDAVERTELAER